MVEAKATFFCHPNVLEDSIPARIAAVSLLILRRHCTKYRTCFLFLFNYQSRAINVSSDLFLGFHFLSARHLYLMSTIIHRRQRNAAGSCLCVVTWPVTTYYTLMRKYALREARNEQTRLVRLTPQHQATPRAPARTPLLIQTDTSEPRPRLTCWVWVWYDTTPKIKLRSKTDR